MIVGGPRGCAVPTLRTAAPILRPRQDASQNMCFPLSSTKLHPFELIKPLCTWRAAERAVNVRVDESLVSWLCDEGWPGIERPGSVRVARAGHRSSVCESISPLNFPCCSHRGCCYPQLSPGWHWAACRYGQPLLCPGPSRGWGLRI